MIRLANFRWYSLSYFVLFVALFATSGRNCQAVDMQFALVYDDVENSTGVGFDDPLLGAYRRAQLLSAANGVASRLNHPNAIVDVLVTSESDGAGLPAVGSACHAVSPFATNGGFFEPYALLQAETAAAPTCPNGGHLTLDVDFGQNFDFDPSNGTLGWDFATVMTHNLVRGIGYGSDGVLAGPTSPYGGSSYNPARLRSFDRMSEFLFFDETGFSPVWGPVGTYNASPAIPLTDGDVFFNDGPFGNAFPMSLGGGTRFEYSGVAGDLMAPLQQGVAQSSLTSNDEAALAAIGWDIAVTVPEPNSTGLAAIGLLFLCGLARRKK